MSKKLAGVIAAALGLLATACSTAPKNYAATDPQMSASRNPKHCLNHPDLLECRQNAADY